MIRKSVLIAAAAGLAFGLAGAAYAQSKPGTPTDFKYELRGNERVEKPDTRTRLPTAPSARKPAAASASRSRKSARTGRSRPRASVTRA